MEPLSGGVWKFVYLTSLLILNVAGAASSYMASFNDSRCIAGGVCSTDPLLFTCELHDILLRVVLPTGYQEIISAGDIVDGVALPDGYTAMSLNIMPLTKSTRNISLTLSIKNSSLLNGGQIRCDNTVNKVVMAGCPLRGPPVPPYNLMQSSNTLTNATITWNSTETDVTYTVTSTSQMPPFSEILQKSYVLSDLKVETDYIVSVTATNECGEVSQPSKNIIVRIDVQGAHDEGDGEGDGEGDENGFSIGIISGAVGGGVVIVVVAGGMCLLVIFMVKKRRTKPDGQGVGFLSDTCASPMFKETPVDKSGDVNHTYQDPIPTTYTPHSSQTGSVVKMPAAVSDDIDPMYSVITAHDSTNDHLGQPCPASTEEETPAGDANPTYQEPGSITHSAHPISGVIYTDINQEKKKKAQKAVEELGYANFDVHQVPHRLLPLEVPCV